MLFRSVSQSRYHAQVFIDVSAELNVLELPATGELVLTSTAPALVILIRSAGELAPSAVVENTRRPGMSLAPGVPSTSAKMFAATTNSDPSEAWKLMLPISSPEATIVLLPIALPLLLAKTRFGSSKPPPLTDIKAILELAPSFADSSCRRGE